MMRTTLAAARRHRFAPAADLTLVGLACLAGLATGTVMAAERPWTPAGVCTPQHLSGCDGTDDPTDGTPLEYCGPDGACTPVPPQEARHGRRDANRPATLPTQRRWGPSI
jgi:hypothetical protein